MSKLEERMTHLEQIVEEHLMQSGEIRTDLAWLKKAFWVLTTAELTFTFSLILYALFRH